MIHNKTIIIDFDSTFIKTETLDSLAEIIYQGSDDLKTVMSDIAIATHACMAGTLSIHEALVSRVNRLKIQKHHIQAIINNLRDQVTLSFKNNKNFILENLDDIFIFSGGFSEIIRPVVADFGIKSHHVFANQFVYDNDRVVGIDEQCLLAHNFGKAKQLLALQRKGSVYVIGDGATDAEIKSVNDSIKFYLFAENILRENLIEKADKVIYSFDEFIQDHKHKI